MIKYHPSIQLAISDAAHFPPFEGGFEKKLEDTNSILNSTDVVELKEWQTYYLKFYTNDLDPSVPSIFKKNDSIYNESFIQDKISDIYVINFKNYVGLSKIGPMNIEVVNRKINKTQYQSLLSYITSRYIDLVYQLPKKGKSDKSHTGYTQKRTRTGSNTDYINYLFLKHKLLGTNPGQQTIQEILGLIIKEPHFKIERELFNTPTELSRATDPTRLIEAVTTGSNLHKLTYNHSLKTTPLAIKLRHLSTSNSAYFPIQLKEERKLHSFDTVENRFIKYFLTELVRLLNHLKKCFSGLDGSYLNPDLEISLNQLTTPIQNCLENQLWSEVLPMRYIPTNSQTLQRKEGYRQLLNLYSLMQLSSKYDFNSFDFSKLVETKNTNILYEFWCFFTVKDILDELFGKIQNYDNLISKDLASTSPSLIEGTYLYYKNDIHLGFNITFKSRADSYSQEYRPDIVIKHKGKHLIFDAKHKLQGWDDDYSKPKKEDVDKMHTYRDAISNTVGAFILYPGERNVLYQFHGSNNLHNGVGGIKLIPDSTKNGQPVDKSKLESLIQSFLIAPTPYDD